MPDPALRRRAVYRPWRWAFVVYAIVLTLGTHWPQLQIPDAAPATDKSIHFFAFGGLTVLLWLTGWFRSRWIAVFIALLWSIADEVSQGIPGLNRWVTVEDASSNALGVVVAGTWLWAMRPVGVEGTRLRFAIHYYIVQDIFARASTWGFIIGTFMVLALPVAALWPLADAATTRRMSLIRSCEPPAASLPRRTPARATLTRT